MLNYLEKTKIYARFEAWFINKSEAYQVAFAELAVTALYVCFTILIVLMLKYD